MVALAEKGNDVARSLVGETCAAQLCGEAATKYLFEAALVMVETLGCGVVNTTNVNDDCAVREDGGIARSTYGFGGV